jgi:tetratricopeptide (TPR) repeat protein
MEPSEPPTPSNVPGAGLPPVPDETTRPSESGNVAAIRQKRAARVFRRAYRTLRRVSRPLNLASLAVLAFVGMTLYDALRTVIVVDPFTVPESFEKSGLTGVVLGNQLIDEINGLRPRMNPEAPHEDLYASLSSTVLDTLYRVPATLSPSLQPPDLEIPKTGLSLKTLSRYIASVVGTDRFRISGELVSVGDRLRLTVRVGSNRAEVFQEDAQDTLKAVDKLMGLAAKRVYRILQPLVWLSWECQQGRRGCESELARGEGWPADQLMLGHLVAGLIRAVQYRFAEAEAEFQAVMVSDLPSQFRDDKRLAEIRIIACVNKAIALKLQRRLDEALVTFAQPMCKQHVDNFSHWAETLLELNRLDDAVATAAIGVRVAEEGVERTPRSPSSKYSAAYANCISGRALFENGRYEEAIVRLRRAEQHDPQYPWTFFWWARALQAQGKRQAAELMLGKVARLGVSDVGQVSYLLATLHVEDNRVTEAIDELQQTIKLNPGYAEPYEQLCVLYAQTKAKRQAVAYCSAYIGLSHAIPNPGRDVITRIAKAEETIRVVSLLPEVRR